MISQIEKKIKEASAFKAKDLKELEWDIDSHTSKIENYKNKNLSWL